MTPRQFLQALDRVNIDAVAQAALGNATTALAEQVRDYLSTSPGGPHDRPWQRTGSLRDSIVCAADSDSGVVASTSPVAALQEHGTIRMTPRPFLAPVASASGRKIANDVAIAVSQALRRL